MLRKPPARTCPTTSRQHHARTFHMPSHNPHQTHPKPHSLHIPQHTQNILQHIRKHLAANTLDSHEQPSPTPYAPGRKTISIALAPQLRGSRKYSTMAHQIPRNNGTQGTKDCTLGQPMGQPMGQSTEVLRNQSAEFKEGAKKLNHAELAIHSRRG
jgi:hypothetical protein